MPEYQYIGHGVYGLAEARRLTGVPSSTIRRWTRGYTYQHRGQTFKSEPVMGVEGESGGTALRFVDLIQIRVLDEFREVGVTWKTLRIAVDNARRLTGHSHPFAHRSFLTDGRSVLLELTDGVLLDVVTSQTQFQRIVRPFLQQIDFGPGDKPTRWWPMGNKHRVVLDPDRCFGAPICADAGIPTRIVSTYYKTVKDVGQVAWWYDVSETEVKDAVEFEQKLAA